MSRRIYQVSGGAGSWRSACIDRADHPSSEPVFVFADTLYEDADAYRFLIEGVAHILGRRLNWLPRAEDFPDYRVAAEVSIEAYAGNPAWRAYLADLRAEVALALPELVWLVDGRDVWEVYRDERLLGNAGKDPCSKILKRRVLAQWLEAECDPAADVVVFGIGEHEAHRYVGGKGSLGLRRLFGERGWRTAAPLVDGRDGLRSPLSFVRAARIEPPRLYRLGYMHNNCGGFCCKAGKAHWRNRLSVQPERFAYDQMMEAKVAAYIGDGYAMLRDRRGGDAKPLPLGQFASEVLADPDFRFDYDAGEGGCGCASEYADDDFGAVRQA